MEICCLTRPLTIDFYCICCKCLGWWCMHQARNSLQYIVAFQLYIVRRSSRLCNKSMVCFLSSSQAKKQQASAASVISAKHLTAQIKGLQPFLCAEVPYSHGCFGHSPASQQNYVFFVTWWHSWGCKTAATEITTTFEKGAMGMQVVQSMQGTPTWLLHPFSI